MASDMSGYSTPGGAQRWMRDSGGTMDDYNREMRSWQNSMNPQTTSQPQSQPQTRPQSQPQAQSQPVNYGNLTAEQSGIQAFNPNDPKAIFRTTSSQDLANMTPEQRARWSMEHIDVLSGEGNRSAPGATREQAYNQWMAWQEHFDPNCPSNTPYRGSRTGSGCYEKPDDDLKDFMGDKWYTSQGMNPDGSPRGGGGGGAAGGGGGYSGSSAWDNPIYRFLGSSGLAAAQDPETALRMYMGQGGAAGYQQQIDQARMKAMSLRPGPARDKAMADLEEMKSQGLTQMKQAATGQARGELGGLLGTEQGYNQMSLQESQFGRSLAEQMRQANMQNALGWGGIGLQRELGLGQLDLGWAGQGLSERQFADAIGAGREWQTNQAALDREANAKNLQMQIDAQKPSTFQKIMGGLGTAAGVAGMFMMSDMRMKENIQEEYPALSAIKDLPVYSYNYKGDSPEDRRLGVMAQDVEQVRPELVKTDSSGIKYVDNYGLTALALSAIKDLDRKIGGDH